MPADSYTNKLRLRQQATGGNTNTWGALLNAAVFQLVEDAICGKADVTVAATDVTLSQANGAQDQARMAIINLIGAPTGPLNCIVPTVSKLYLVINNTGQVMTVKTSGGTGIPVNVAANQWVACDGTNVIAVQAAASGTVTNSLQLGGIVAAEYARLDIFNQFLAGSAHSFANLTDAPTVTLNAMLSDCFYVLLGGNRTLAITNPADGQKIELWLQQDGTGSRTMSWPVNVFFEGGTTGLSSTPNNVDRVLLTYKLSLDRWIARIGMQSPAAGATQLTISSNETDVYLFGRAGSPGSPVTVNVSIAAGVVLEASSPGSPALDLSGFPSGSTINLVNNGYILGAGGDGGMGAEIGASGSSITDLSAGQKGTDGGPAILGPGSGRNCNITNGSGFIWGGGGGGGGGGAQATGTPSAANGGGGGGGKGGGRSGIGGRSAAFAGVLAANGTPGGNGPNAVAGTGGAGNHGGGSTQGGAGGAGGDWATQGTAGATVSGAGQVTAAAVGGQPGKAIDVNGGSISFVSGSGGPNVKGNVS